MTHETCTDDHASRPGERLARRKSEATDLYQIVQQQLETLLASAAARELRALLRCGILARTVSCACTATAVGSIASSPSRERAAASVLRTPPPHGRHRRASRRFRLAGGTSATPRWALAPPARLAMTPLLGPGKSRCRLCSAGMRLFGVALGDALVAFALR
jgi:hypothetical protein